MKKRIVVVPYDARWPSLFGKEQARIARVFRGVDAAIEHVGSTAVPGLASKPIIDIMLGLRTLAEAESRIGALAECGYEYVPEYEDELPERRYFRRPSHRPRTHHLHCVVAGGDFWRRHIAFRDYLRAHPEAAERYGELKMELALAHETDGRAYTEAKSPFVESVLAETGTR